MASVTAATRLPISKSDTARILRDHRLRDLVSAIAEWQRATGPERDYWREEATWRLSQWRRMYQEPERAAFQQAVARGRT